MTVVFVADEGVADSGFNATYQAVSLADSQSVPIGALLVSLNTLFLCLYFLQLFSRSSSFPPLLYFLFLPPAHWLTFSCISLFIDVLATCGPRQFACSSGECLHPEWLCDGWSDCSDGADEEGCGNATFPSFSESLAASETGPTGRQLSSSPGGPHRQVHIVELTTPLKHACNRNTTTNKAGRGK